MGATSDAATGHRFRSQILLLRGRAGLTQRALAALLGISEHAIQKWEAGQGYPSAARLQALIALYVQRGVFAPGREAEKEQAFIVVAGDVIIDRHLALWVAKGAKTPTVAIPPDLLAASAPAGGRRRARRPDPAVGPRRGRSSRAARPRKRGRRWPRPA